MRFRPISFVSSDYGLAVVTLVIMSVQMLFIEGWDVSIPKVAFMAMTPLFLFAKARVVSKALMLALLYLFVTVALMFIQFGSVRTSTFYYSALFMLTFNLYYTLVYYKHVFTIDGFISVLKGLIYAYAICLALQQMCMLVGLRYIPMINLMNLRYYELFRLNTLAIEPSHAARLLTVIFYAILKLLELKNGEVVPIAELWDKHKRVIIAFLYTMLCIGSGTAFVGLAILSLYFLRKQYALVVIIVALLLYMAVPYIDYEPLNRAMATFNAALSGDTELVRKVDNSAAARVNIILDTFLYLDFSDPATWLGNGVDAASSSGKAIVAAITYYGLLSYICKLIFIFSCCFSGLFSLEVLIFILLFSMDVGNIAYGYSMLMVFSTVKYFRLNYVADDSNSGS